MNDNFDNSYDDRWASTKLKKLAELVDKKGGVQPMLKAVYCWEIEEYVPAVCCSHCNHQSGYAFVKGEGDRFGPICDLSEDQHEPTPIPTFENEIGSLKR